MRSEMNCRAINQKFVFYRTPLLLFIMIITVGVFSYRQLSILSNSNVCDKRNIQCITPVKLNNVVNMVLLWVFFMFNVL